MKYVLGIFASAILVSACSKKDITNPDDLITYEKHVYLRPGSCDTVFTFYIPSAFTPNGDGNNEYWEPKSCGLDSSQYHIDILDKKGKVIFQSDTPARFSGKGKNGLLVAEQTLCYYIEAKDKFYGGSYKFKGQFAVIR